MARAYYFYMMASYRGALYAAVTNDLTRRAYEHQRKVVEGFTKKYNATKLVYYEVLTASKLPLSAKSRSKAGSGERRLRLSNR